MNTKFVKIIALIGLMSSLANPAVAGKISLESLSQYINNLPIVKGGFTQINPNGSRDSGKIYVARPGKMRFEYNEPNNALVLASAGSIAVYDDKSNSGPRIYPLRRSPLNLFLAKNVDLSKNGMVIDHKAQGKFTIVTAQDPKNPNLGKMEMMFTDNPVALRQWVITDQSRRRTTVILSDLEPQKKLPLKYFLITKDKSKNRN